jgi:hypothetical protein
VLFTIGSNFFYKTFFSSNFIILYSRTINCLQNTLIYIIIVCKQTSAYHKSSDLPYSKKTHVFYLDHRWASHIYIAEFPSIFSVYSNYTSVFSYLFRSILNLHRHFKILSNENFLDIQIKGDNRSIVL